MINEMVNRIERRIMAELDQSLRDMAAVVIFDPGRDIHPLDTGLWLKLLTEAEKIDRNLHSVLFYIRGGGAQLVPSGSGYVIRPILSQAGWPDMETYDREKKCMFRYKNEIVELLGALK